MNHKQLREKYQAEKPSLSELPLEEYTLPIKQGELFVENEVVGILRDQLGNSVFLHTDLADWGTDLIDYEEIAHELEISFETEIDFEKLNKCKNGHEIAQMIWKGTSSNGRITE